MYNLTWRMIRKQLFYVEVSEVPNTRLNLQMCNTRQNMSSIKL